MKKITALKESNNMNYIDKKDVNGKDVNTNLFGPDENTPHRRMELMFRPADCQAPTDCKKKL